MDLHKAINASQMNLPPHIGGERAAMQDAPLSPNECPNRSPTIPDESSSRAYGQRGLSIIAQRAFEGFGTTDELLPDLQLLGTVEQSHLRTPLGPDLGQYTPLGLDFNTPYVFACEYAEVSQSSHGDSNVYSGSGEYLWQVEEQLW